MGEEKVMENYALFQTMAGNRIYLEKKSVEYFEAADWGVHINTKSGDTLSLNIPFELFIDKMFGVKLLVAAAVVDA